MNFSHLLSTAIEPPIALSLTDMGKPNSFILSDETTYSINTGAEFGIRCSSEVIHADDEIGGKVTWYKEPGQPLHCMVCVLYPVCVYYYKHLSGLVCIRMCVL